MKNSSLSFVSLYKFGYCLAVALWSMMLAASLNAQDLISDIESTENDHHICIQQSCGGELVATPYRRASQVPLSQSDIQIKAPEFDQFKFTDLPFDRHNSGYRQARPEEDIPLQQLLEQPFKSPKFGESSNDAKRPIERFLYPNGDEEKKVILDDDPPAKAADDNRFHWRQAINQSLMVLGLQHGYALVAQEKTRRAVANGNFFSDYWRSVRSLRGWDDGNKFFTNYIAHPMQGGLTGFIFVQNHDRVKKQKFGESKQYWKDRFKAFVWSTAWSTQFELGPISQSSIGNVGLYGGMGYVDLVLTPTVGTAWLISEEAIDRYIVRHIEKRSFMLRIFVRTFLNPMRSVANMLRFKEPWYRDRPLGH